MIPNLRKVSSLHSKGNRLMSFLSMSTMCLLITASIVIITIISITPIIILSLGKSCFFTGRINQCRPERFDIDAINSVHEFNKNPITFRTDSIAKIQDSDKVKRIKFRDWVVYGFERREIKPFGDDWWG